MKIQRIDKLGNKVSVWSLERFLNLLDIMEMNKEQKEEAIFLLNNNQEYITNFATYTKIESRLSDEDKLITNLLKALGIFNPVPFQIKLLKKLIKDTSLLEELLDSLENKHLEEEDIRAQKLSEQDFNSLMLSIEPATAIKIKSHLLAIHKELDILKTETEVLNREVDLTSLDILQIKGSVSFLINSEDPKHQEWGKQLEKALKWIERESKSALLHKAIQEKRTV